MAAIAVSVTSAAVAIADAASPTFTLPSPVDHVTVAAGIGVWILYTLRSGFSQLGAVLREREEAACWAEGYVHGVARRTPPDERVRWMED